MSDCTKTSVFRFGYLVSKRFAVTDLAALLSASFQDVWQRGTRQGWPWLLVTAMCSSSFGGASCLSLSPCWLWTGAPRGMWTTSTWKSLCSVTWCNCPSFCSVCAEPTAVDTLDHFWACQHKMGWDEDMCKGSGWCQAGDSHSVISCTLQTCRVGGTIRAWKGGATELGSSRSDPQFWSF